MAKNSISLADFKNTYSFTESQNSKEAIGYLHYNGYQVTRVQSGEFHGFKLVKDKNGKLKQVPAHLKFAEKGTADYLVWKNIANWGWLEMKATKGKQSDDQKRFEAECKKRGIPYAKANDLEAVKATFPPRKPGEVWEDFNRAQELLNT